MTVVQPAIHNVHGNGIDVNEIRANGAVVWRKEITINVSDGYGGSGGLNVKALIDKYNPHHALYIKVKLDYRVQKLVSGNLAGLHVTVEVPAPTTALKWPGIYGATPGGTAVALSSPLKLINKGFLFAGGGNGGKGGTGHLGVTGGVGTHASNKTVTTTHTKAYNSNTGKAWAVKLAGMYSTSTVWGQSHSGNPGSVKGGRGTITKGGLFSQAGGFYWYSTVEHYTTSQLYRGGAGGAGGRGGNGGAGGAGGLGSHGFTNSVAGHAGASGAGGHGGSRGHPSSPAGGYTGGTGKTGGRGYTGGAGGHGGDWGVAGTKGARGQGSGSYGANGTAGGKAITGKRFLVSGSVTGNARGAIV